MDTSIHEVFWSNPAEYTPEQLRKPTHEEIDECTRRTAELLGLANAGVSVVPMNAKLHNTKPKDAIYVEYTPFNATTKRIIKIQEVIEDPLAPSKFKLGKPMARPPSPPPSFVRDTRGHKPTAEEIEQWKIPTAQSNWVNPKSFIIDLATRVSLDGRTHHQQQISENFAKFTETLSATERQSAKQAQARAQMLQQAEQLKRERIQQDLNRQAETLRGAHLQSTNGVKSESRQTEEYHIKQEQLDDSDASSLEATAELARREQLRERISREVAGSLNLRREDLQRLRTSASQQQEARIRDISETMALGGNAQPSTAARSAAIGRFDERLYEKAQKEQSYSVGEEGEHMYDRPLFDDTGPRNYHVYRGHEMEKEIREDLEQSQMATGKGALTRTDAVQFERVGAQNTDHGRQGGINYATPRENNDEDDINSSNIDDDIEYQHKRQRLFKD